MALLTIIYDAHDPPLRVESETASRVKTAQMTVPDDLTERDIYEVARDLAGLLLEQLTR